MSYIGKNPEADSIKLKGSATEPSGTAVDGQVYFNTGAGSISKGMKVYKNSQFVAIDKQLGDAETMQLLKAADIPAIDFSLSVTSTTVGGNNAVPFESSTGDFDGTAAFTNSSTGDALLTDDSDDLVFHYTTQATNSADNDFWGIPLTVPRAFRGGNLVLEFKYRTEIATGTMDNGYFNIAIQDRSAMILQTQDSTISAGPIAAGSNVLLDGKTYSNPVTGTTLTVAVGDRVFVESGTGAAGSQTNDIVDCYITSVSSTDNNVTLSKDIVAVQDGKFVTGWLTGYDTGGQIDAFASDTNKDGTTKKLAFKTDADTQQISLWFFVKGTSTVKHELFFDNVLLSGNKFLQVSQSVKPESYTRGKGAGYWLSSTGTAWSSGASYRIDWSGGTISNLPGPDTPTYDQSKYLDFTTKVNGTDTVSAICAKKKVKLSWTVGNDSADNQTVRIYLSRGGATGVVVGITQQRGDNDTSIEASADVVLDVDDYVYGYMSGGSYNSGWHSIVATPIDSSAVVLESQDEIFTSWVEYTPTLNGVTSTAANTKFAWRRVGDSMEIAGSFYSATVAASELYFTLPSGYEVDQSIFYAGDRTAVGVGSREGTSIYGYEKGNTANLFVKAGGANLDRIYFNAQSGGSYFTAVNGNSWMGTSEAASVRVWSVPIKGWNANFNPLLSMPLVNIGTDYATYNGQLGSTSVNYHRYVSSVSIDTLTNSGLATITQGSSTAAFRITASVDVFVSGNFSWGSSTVSTEDFGIVAGTGTAILDSTKSFGNSDFDGGMRKTSSMFSTTGEVENAACGFILKAGEHMIIAGGSSGGAHYSGYSGLINFTFQRIRANTNMAHIIKPAVAVAKAIFSSTTVNPVGSSSTGFVNLPLNTFEGETWFLTPGTGTLGVGGTNTDFTLEPGTYKIVSSNPQYNCGNSANRLVGGSTFGDTYLIGQTGYSDNSYNTQVFSQMSGVLTLTSTTSFRVQANSTVTATNAFGVANTELNSVYLQLTIEKLK